MDYSEITKLVIIKLEEYSAYLTRDGNSLNGVILSGGDDIDSLKPIYSYIEAHIAEAADEVLMNAPLNKMLAVACPTQPVADENKILLPPDFMRLHTLRMQGWERPVHKTITMDDPLCALQYNKYTKGTPQKPVVIFSGERLLRVFSNNDDLDYIYYVDTLPTVSGRSKGFEIDKYGSCMECRTSKLVNTPYLEYYSVSEGNNLVEELQYIPHFRKSLEYNTEIAETIALNCAKKIFEVYGQTERVNIVTAELQSVLSNMAL